MPPYLTPLQIFENYKKANPQKCKGKSTTEICRLAGLNEKQIAELKTTSTWLFCFDKENVNTNQDFSITEILRGSFSKSSVRTSNTPQVLNNQVEKIDLKGKPFSDVKKVIDKRVRDLSNKYELKTGGNSQLYKDAQKVINSFKQEYGNLNSSSMQYFYEPYYKTYEKDDEIIGKMREQYFKYELSAKAQYEEESALVKKYQLANCGECADLVTKICYEQFKDKYNVAQIIFNSVPSNQDNQHFAVLMSAKDGNEEFVVDLWINPQKGCIFRKDDWNAMCKELYSVKDSNVETSDHDFINLKHEQFFWDNMPMINSIFPDNEIKTIEDFFNLLKVKINKNENLPEQIVELYYMYCERYTDYGEERDNFRTQKFDYVKNKYNSFYQEFSKQKYPEKLETLKNYLDNIKINSSVIDILLKEADTLINDIDNECYGWGNGKNKKELMSPLIDYVINIAKLGYCKSDDINNFQKICNEELDATFYTDEKNIISAFKTMLEKIKDQYGHNSYLF